MSQRKVRISVPTEGRRGRRIRLRDVVVTLSIVLFIVGVFFVVNGLQGQEEGSFITFSPFTGGLPSGPAPAIGSLAPDFEVPLLNGGVFRLSEHRGQVVWINFWVTWCSTCRAEMPDIEKAWRDEQGTDLALVAIDFAERSETIQEYADRLDVTFSIGLDATGRLSTDYRIAGFPSHFMVDRSGILRDIRVGPMSEETMREKLKQLRSYG